MIQKKSRLVESDNIINLKPVFQALHKEVMFENAADFYSRRMKVIKKYNYDLKDVIFRFRNQLEGETIDFQNTYITSTPKLIDAQKCVSANKMFFGIRKLTYISPRIFNKMQNITDFSQCFASTGITDIPDEIFNSNVNISEHGAVTKFNNMFKDTKIVEVRRQLFKKHRDTGGNGYDFNGMFSDCLDLTSVHSDILTRAIDPETSYIARMFYGCSNITTGVPPLWEGSQYSYGGAFKNNKAHQYASKCNKCKNWNKVPMQYGGRFVFKFKDRIDMTINGYSSNGDRYYYGENFSTFDVLGGCKLTSVICDKINRRDATFEIATNYPSVIQNKEIWFSINDGEVCGKLARLEDGTYFSSEFKNTNILEKYAGKRIKLNLGYNDEKPMPNGWLDFYVGNKLVMTKELFFSTDTYNFMNGVRGVEINPETYEHEPGCRFNTSRLGWIDKNPQKDGNSLNRYNESKRLLEAGKMFRYSDMTIDESEAYINNGERRSLFCYEYDKIAIFGTYGYSFTNRSWQEPDDKVNIVSSLRFMRLLKANDTMVRLFDYNDCILFSDLDNRDLIATSMYIFNDKFTCIAENIKNDYNQTDDVCLYMSKVELSNSVSRRELIRDKIKIRFNWFRDDSTNVIDVNGKIHAWHLYGDFSKGFLLPTKIGNRNSSFLGVIVNNSTKMNLFDDTAPFSENGFYPLYGCKSNSRTSCVISERLPNTSIAFIINGIEIYDGLGYSMPSGWSDSSVTELMKNNSNAPHSIYAMQQSRELYKYLIGHLNEWIDMEIVSYDISV